MKTRSFSVSMRAIVLGVLAAAVAGRALALTAEQVFDKVSPSVWVVKTFDAAGRPLLLGSAVVVKHGELVTNCHVLAKAKYVHVRRKNVIYEASLEYADIWRDMCLLKVDNFDAPAVAIRLKAELKVGERVYAIGNPAGFEVTLSDGLISGLRPLTGKFAAHGVDELIQTTAPTSPGSSGGGLFDSEGRLVGITTLGSVFILQNLNFAEPTDWIAEVPARAKAVLAKSAGGTASAGASGTGAPGLPAAGTTWTYGSVEELFSNRQVKVKVRAVRVDGGDVEELVTSDSGDAQDLRREVDVHKSRFLDYPLDSNSDLIELSPYLLASSAGKAPKDIPSPSGYPMGSPELAPWIITIRQRGWVQVTVAAGTFRALRIDVAGKRAHPVFGPWNKGDGRFEMKIWYAPQAKRYVRLVRETWAASGNNPVKTAHYVVQLLAFHPPS